MLTVGNFSGKVNAGLILHPDNEHIIFPLGTTIVVRHIISRTQQFLRGHDNDISVITVSNTGKYIASGQKTHMGFQVSLNVHNSTLLVSKQSAAFWQLHLCFQSKLC